MVTAARTASATNPKCGCGSRMRKAYARPLFRQIRPDELKTMKERFGFHAQVIRGAEGEISSGR